MSKPSKVLIVGSGGREHALAWRCALEGADVTVAPGSDAMATLGRCVPISDHVELTAFAQNEAFDLVIVGPEQPLVDGLADRLRESGLNVLGPSAAAARLEGSKADAKAFMQRHGIPTARCAVVDNLETGLKCIREFESPPVIKADGLAAGKGVVVAESFEEAEAALRDCMSEQKFGSAGQTVVIEERLVGQEASFFAVTDGENYVTFEAAQDHKRIFEGDQGPNTGGMGAYAPAPIVSSQVELEIISRILEPTIRGLKEEGRPFIGVLFIGLMIDPSGRPSVIEYNVRFGDPEVQPLMFGAKDQVLPHFLAAARGELTTGKVAGEPALTVVLASAGYPAGSTKGCSISGLDDQGGLAVKKEGTDDVQIFHAGTRKVESEKGIDWQSNGGRVLGVCAKGSTLQEAIASAYNAVEALPFEGRQLRRDIGSKASASS